MTRRLLQAALAVAVSAACLAWLAEGLDLAALGAAVAAFEPAPLVLALAVAASLPFWRAARLAALLPPVRRPGGGALTRLAAEVLLWNVLLPFKLGELSFPWLLHRRVGLPLREATALFLLFRLGDLATVAGLLLLGASTLPPVAARGLEAVALVTGLGLIAVPVAVIAAAGRRHAAGGGRIARLVAGAGHARTGRARLAVTATTLGLWGSHAAIAALVVAAGGGGIAAPAVVAASAAGNLAFALPVAGVLGLGPQQVGFATTLDLAGVAWTRAVAIAIAVHAVVTVAAVVAGLAAWLSAPRPARPLARPHDPPVR